MHPRGAEFEARKRRKVYLISFDMVIKIKVVKFECATEISVISPLTVTRFTPRNSVQKCMNILTIFLNNMICLFVDEKNTTFYSVIFHIG